jgi:uncharacterized protein YhfF
MVVGDRRRSGAPVSDERSQSVEKFWRASVDATGVDGPYTASAFGNDPQMADSLGALVRDGMKRATTSLLSWYEGDEDPEPMPKVGDLTVVLDGRDDPICVIRTVKVEVRPFGEVDEAFARVEGEGDGSLAYWRDAHISFFASEGCPVDDDTPVVLDSFELIWPGPRAGGNPQGRRSGIEVPWS